MFVRSNILLNFLRASLSLSFWGLGSDVRKVASCELYCTFNYHYISRLKHRFCLNSALPAIAFTRQVTIIFPIDSSLIFINQYIS
ncbi:hypothetical protein BDB00DRAFT_824501 [Zychaea mexicana]|uniref:uncharacterized protein n=1 Tax=Zychaea mexicana TaxID=64656 RepID=UPI0022FE7D5D|nr:uncharacterized protein BDB00DRAFT_824501 [Zychaea mexicana]KAI9493127.1 hypothetical protein BDB00DRAFT_824501 [Zychaea mexicana]